MSIFQKIENKNEWDNLLDKVHFKTFFHTFGWENFLEKEFSWLTFKRYVWKDELLLSVARCRLFGKEKLVSHPLCEYGGPLAMKKEVDFESFVRDFHQEFGSGARIKFHPYLRGAGDYSLAHSRPPAAASEVRPGQSMLHQASNPPGNNPQPLLATFWIEDFSKKSPEDLWGSFRKTLKQEIKKGEGFAEIRECQNENELKQFYNLYLSTVRGHKNIPLPFSIFGMFNEHTNEHTKIFLAKKDGRVVGGSVFLFYSPFIHYFISASDGRFRGENIGHQILWNVIQKYAGGPYDYFDLGGTRKGSGLEVFKRGWGAKEYPIYEIGDRGGGGRNSLLRNMLGVMPAKLIKHIAPFALWMKV